MYSLRGKPVVIEQHAHEGLNAERPPIPIHHVVECMESPDAIERERGPEHRVRRWLAGRTVIVTYVETEQEIEVIACSATRRKFST